MTVYEYCPLTLGLLCARTLEHIKRGEKPFKLFTERKVCSSWQITACSVNLDGLLTRMLSFYRPE